MSSINMKVATVVVTFNRLDLLKQSINAHINQSKRPELLLIVDNCSTDDTPAYLEQLNKTYDFVKIIRSNINLGGAGGFSIALDYIVSEDTYDWVWLMDDDAIPDQNALEKLCSIKKSENFIYGSLPLNKNICVWPNYNLEKKLLQKKDDFNEIEEVGWIPFLGFFINCKLVKKIGLPDKDFFIAADDVEYSLRAKKNGSRIFIVKDSNLEHPCPEIYKLFIGYRYISNLRLAPWKRYYDTRNRLFVAQRYYGLKYYYQTIPGSFLRLISILIFEDQKNKQIKAFFAGLYDAFFNKSGKRHDHWGL